MQSCGEVARRASQQAWLHEPTSRPSRYVADWSAGAALRNDPSAPKSRDGVLRNRDVAPAGLDIGAARPDVTAMWRAGVRREPDPGPPNDPAAPKCRDRFLRGREIGPGRLRRRGREARRRANLVQRDPPRARRQARNRRHWLEKAAAPRLVGPMSALAALTPALFGPTGSF